MNNAGPKQEAAAAREDIPGIPLVIKPGAITGIIAAIPKMIGEIKQLVERRIAANPKTIFSVSTHEKTKYQDYVSLLDELKKAKATKISIANQ